MFWIFTLGLFAGLALDLHDAQQITKSAFSCANRATGYYADVTTGCQVYHMCDGLGRQFSYTCPNATLFQQRMLICDHWYMVNCSRSEEDYSANLLIGQKRPFVEDSPSHPYSRTPRPDLLSAPSNDSEYNIIYQTGKDQNITPENVVGVESENTDEPTYVPPSYWSRDYSPRPSSTVQPVRSSSYNNNQQKPKQTSFYRTQYNSVKNTETAKAKAIDFNSANRNGNNVLTAPAKNKFNTISPTELPMHFPSNFKATTPVYPPRVQESLSSLKNEIGLLPPIPYANKKSSDTSQSVAYESTRILNSQNSEGNNVEATTPVSSSRERINDQTTGVILETEEKHVNYESNFKATTLVYPSAVDQTSPNPDEVGLLPPQEKTKSNEATSVNFRSNFSAATPVYPIAVDPTSPDPSDAGLLPPQANRNKDEETGENRVNFNSNFKATTPVYPTAVDSTSPDPDAAGLLPPQVTGDNNTLAYHVNFQSKFKATTPVYPTVIDTASSDPSEAGLIPPQRVDSYDIPDDKASIDKGNGFVNYASKYTASTPVYPTSVEPTSPDPDEAGLLPPQIKERSDDRAPFGAVKLDEGAKSSKDYFIGTSSPPAKFYQPPELETNFPHEEDLQQQPGNRIANFMKSFNYSQWQDLRKVFHIPEYEFPLDDATRPSYDSVINSFEARRIKKR